QRVESYNSLIKRSVKSSSTLLELDAHIQFLLDREEQFERQEQTSENPTVGLPNVIGRYFKRIDVIIKKFLTPRVLKMQHRQMNESLLYRPSKIEDWENLLESEQKQDEERSDNEKQSDEKHSDNEEQSDEERSDNEEQSD